MRADQAGAFLISQSNILKCAGDAGRIAVVELNAPPSLSRIVFEKERAIHV
jgi:hypothetical protein